MDEDVTREIGLNLARPWVDRLNAKTRINAIKKKVDEINAAGGELIHDLERGDLVKIQHGSFTGYEAIFDTRIPGSERVRVLLKLLEGTAKLELPVNLLERKQKANPR